MPVSESKTYQKFNSRVDYLRQHLQVIDASLKKTSQLLRDYNPKNTPIAGALGVSPSNYNRLNHPISRFNMIFSYTKGKNSEYAIIELFNAFSNYMNGILHEMYNHEPEKIIFKAGGNKSISFKELKDFTTIDQMKQALVDKVFRSLENERSTVKLIDKIISHTSIIIDAQIKNNALLYLEMRHLFIHNNGLADDAFKTKFGALINISSDNKLPKNFSTTSKGIIAVTKLVKEVDSKLIAGGNLQSR